MREIFRKKNQCTSDSNQASKHLIEKHQAFLKIRHEKSKHQTHSEQTQTFTEPVRILPCLLV